MEKGRGTGYRERVRVWGGQVVGRGEGTGWEDGRTGSVCVCGGRGWGGRSMLSQVCRLACPPACLACILTLVRLHFVNMGRRGHK